VKLQKIVFGLLLSAATSCNGQSSKVETPIFVGSTFESVKSVVAQDLLAKALYEDLISTTEKFSGLNASPKSKKQGLKQARDITQQAMQNAFLFRISNDERYLIEAKAFLNAACELPDWNPGHFLDLSEIVFGVAVTANWLNQSLDPLLKSKVERSLQTKAFSVYINLATKPKERFWTSGKNNWTLVCNSALYVASVLNPDVPGSGQVRQLARANLEKGFDLYAPNGLWVEGPMYWSYATNYAVFATEAERWATRTTSSLVSKLGFNKTLPTFLSLVGPSGLTFNYGDANTENIGVTPGALKLGEYFNQQKEVKTYLDLIRLRVIDNQKAYNHRFALFHLLWFPASIAETKTEASNLNVIRGEFDLAIFNTQPNSDKNIYLALKGGAGANQSHQHRDAGSFVLDYCGVRFFSDLGKEDYQLKTKDGKSIDKKTVYRVSTAAHNVIRVGQNEQAELQTEPINVNESSKSVIMNLSNRYQECASVKRKVSIDDTGILMEDIAVGCSDSIHWQGITKAKIILKGNKVILTNRKKKIVLEVLKPTNSVIKVLDPKPSRLEESPNNRYKQIVISCGSSSNGLKVRFSPN